MLPAEYFELDLSGTRIPARGLGTFQPDPAACPTGSVKQSVLTALKSGYRHVDTSLRYDNGQNEVEVGEAVRESGIPREDIFIVTKLSVDISPFSSIWLINPTKGECFSLA